MIIEWTNTAVDEFIKILSRYKKTTAEKIANEITTRVEGLIKFPQKGRVVPEFNVIYIRELIYKDFRIIYIISDKIYIAHIRNSKQRLKNI